MHAHAYEVRLRSDKHGFDLISDALPVGGLWDLEVFAADPNSVIRLYDEAGNVIDAHDHGGEFKEPQ